MRALLLATTVLAFLAALAPLRMFLAWAFMLLFVYLPVVAMGAFVWYARGNRQAFALGALAASLIALYTARPWLVSEPYRDWRVFASLAVLEVLSWAACGYAAVAVRRLVYARGWAEGDRKKSDPPANQ
jgi:hypothetical protein